MSRYMLSQILVLVGVAAIAFSFLVPILLRSGGDWSEENALELSKSQHQLQAAVLGEAKAKGPSEKVSFAKKRAEMEEKVAELQEELEGSIDRSSLPAMIMLILGAVLVGGGWFTYQTMPATEEEKHTKTLSEMDPDYVPPEVVDVTPLDYTTAVRVSKTKKRQKC